jgi:hypothetical protein
MQVTRAVWGSPIGASGVTLMAIVVTRIDAAGQRLEWCGPIAGLAFGKGNFGNQAAKKRRK